jgi:hypothetical protein
MAAKYLGPKVSLGEFRFYTTATDGKRKLKVQAFDSLKYPTERDVRGMPQATAPNSQWGTVVRAGRGFTDKADPPGGAAILSIHLAQPGQQDLP